MEMRRTHSGAQKRNPLIDMIPAFFYESLITLAMIRKDINPGNIEDKIREYIQDIIISVYKNSKDKSGYIALTNDIEITLNNCPLLYQPLLKKLLDLKPLYDSPVSIEVQPYIDEKIKDLAQRVMAISNFQLMLPGIKECLLSGCEGVETQLPLDETGVTTELIREVFYNEMAIQGEIAVKSGLISIKDLEEQESNIYFALPALALIEMINQSKRCAGIRLGDKMLTSANCKQDELFSELFDAILEQKNNLRKMSKEAVLLLKRLCLWSDNEIPDELLKFRTNAVTDCAGVINRITEEISRRPKFKELIQPVIETCIALCQDVKEVKL